MAPPLLRSAWRTSYYTGCRRLRSSKIASCEVPRTRTSLGDRSLTVAEPLLWNNLPLYLRDSELTHLEFHQLLNTHLFDEERGDWWLLLLERLINLLTYLLLTYFLDLLLSTILLTVCVVYWQYYVLCCVSLFSKKLVAFKPSLSLLLNRTCQTLIWSQTDEKSVSTSVWRSKKQQNYCSNLFCSGTHCKEIEESLTFSEVVPMSTERPKTNTVSSWDQLLLSLTLTNANPISNLSHF